MFLRSRIDPSVELARLLAPCDSWRSKASFPKKIDCTRAVQGIGISAVCVASAVSWNQ
jgi:hypothetical protein